jgi:hypothetical protein
MYKYRPVGTYILLSGRLQGIHGQGDCRGSRPWRALRMQARRAARGAATHKKRTGAVAPRDGASLVNLAMTTSWAASRSGALEKNFATDRRGLTEVDHALALQPKHNGSGFLLDLLVYECMLRLRKGPRLAILRQTCNHFSPQCNFETVRLLATKFGMALGIHLEKQARMVRPRPSARVAALAPLQRRGGCGNTLRNAVLATHKHYGNGSGNRELSSTNPPSCPTRLRAG